MGREIARLHIPQVIEYRGARLIKVGMDHENTAVAGKMRVGIWEDPKDLMGLAHAVEHGEE